MPFVPVKFTEAEAVTFALLLILAVVAVVVGYRSWRRSRVSPAQRERERRAILVSRGKLGDAEVVEIREQLVFYSYAVRGVGYTASQDLSFVESLAPADLAAAIGPVLVRYDAQNPANSIILAEQWSGLRRHANVRRTVS